MRSVARCSAAQLAARPALGQPEGSDRSFVSRLLDLTLLAPDIQEAILEGRQAKGMQLEELMGAMPAEWGEQRQAIC